MAEWSRRWFSSPDRDTQEGDLPELDLLCPASYHSDSEMNRIDLKSLRIAREAGDDLSFWDFLRNRADGPEVALVYAHAFWPELVEVDGFVLLCENYDPEYLARVVADCGHENVEATINTTYLQDLFGSNTQEAAETTWTALGEMIRDAWKARAEALFPDREFAATFAWYSAGSDPGVTLYQTKRGASSSARTRQKP